jgi:TetR/AcrR family tetracycline transcriptional repressor
MKFKPLPLSDPVQPSEPAIDQATITRAALELLDQVGFEGLTMRSLAKKLGIKASSLYWHLTSKQDLLGLLAEEICNPMREPDRTLPWLEQLDALAHDFRRVLLIHRDAARILANSGGPTGPKRLRLAELMLRTLLDAGFERQDAAYAGFLMNDYVTMFVAEETQHHGQGADEAAAAQVQTWMEGLPQKDYPSMIALAPYLAAPDADERFDFGVQIIKTGLEARLARSRR